MEYAIEIIGPNGLEVLPVARIELGVGEHGVRLDAVLVERNGELLDIADAGIPVDDIVVAGVRQPVQ
jgi:hypothetical protein